MATAFEQVRTEYIEKGAKEAEWMASAAHDEIVARRDELFLHVGEEVAEFLRSLAIARGARMLVELGTSLGFSTLFLADAARRNGGRLITFELNEQKQAYAREQLARAGLADVVDWRLGDCVAGLNSLDSDVDFVLIDVWKDLYVPCFNALLPNLAPDAIVVADNMLRPSEARADAEVYRLEVSKQPDFTSVLLPIGQGIELSCRNGDLARVEAAA